MSLEEEKSFGRGLWIHTAFTYWATTAIVFLGVCLGHSYLAESHHQHYFQTQHRSDLAAAFANWDGQWYIRIARDGYFNDPSAQSSVAFFPALPLAGRSVALVTGLDYDIALTLVANVSFFLALGLFGIYIRRRSESPSRLALYAPLALALFPVGFFFRMAYSESLFLLLTVLVFYGLERRWPILAVATLVGLTTATRAVGVALIPPVLLAGWRRYASSAQRLVALTPAVLLSVWGLGAYMIFQYERFGEPLAFSKTLVHWRFRDKSSRGEQLLAAVAFEPLWTVYDESSPAYWRWHDRELGPAFSLQFANPIYFVGMAGLVGLGAWRRWLSAEEILLCGWGAAYPLSE
jgi:Gpi18-like mannosyltransferase